MTFTYFGYGSLVNADTVPAGIERTPGRLVGWMREWRVCGIDAAGLGRCSLTVREQSGSEILGVMAREPKTGLAVLEERERRYEKVLSIGAHFRCEAERRQGPDDLFVFRALPEYRSWGNTRYPILQSYLDCVLAGYHATWGAAGVHHFFETTDGWQAPVLADRERPIYPRSIRLDPDVRDLIDREVQGRGMTVINDD